MREPEVAVVKDIRHYAGVTPTHRVRATWEPYADNIPQLVVDCLRQSDPTERDCRIKGDDSGECRVQQWLHAAGPEAITIEAEPGTHLPFLAAVTRVGADEEPVLTAIPDFGDVSANERCRDCTHSRYWLLTRGDAR